MKLPPWKALLLTWVLLLAVAPQRVLAQADSARLASLESRVSGLEHDASLESRVSRLENNLSSHADKGAVILLFGAFCALWAQNTRRNAWLWFFLGALFNVITVLVLLHKNSRDRGHSAALG